MTHTALMARAGVGVHAGPAYIGTGTNIGGRGSGKHPILWLVLIAWWWVPGKLMVKATWWFLRLCWRLTLAAVVAVRARAGAQTRT